MIIYRYLGQYLILKFHTMFWIFSNIILGPDLAHSIAMLSDALFQRQYLNKPHFFKYSTLINTEVFIDEYKLKSNLKQIHDKAIICDLYRWTISSRLWTNCLQYLKNYYSYSYASSCVSIRHALLNLWIKENEKKTAFTNEYYYKCTLPIE